MLRVMDEVLETSTIDDEMEQWLERWLTKFKNLQFIIRIYKLKNDLFKINFQVDNDAWINASVQNFISSRSNQLVGRIAPFKYTWSFISYKSEVLTTVINFNNSLWNGLNFLCRRIHLKLHHFRIFASNEAHVMVNTWFQT
jgi:hypothetical protein